MASLSVEWWLVKHSLFFCRGARKLDRNNHHVTALFKKFNSNTRESVFLDFRKHRLRNWVLSLYSSYKKVAIWLLGFVICGQWSCYMLKWGNRWLTQKSSKVKWKMVAQVKWWVIGAISIALNSQPHCLLVLRRRSGYAVAVLSYVCQIYYMTYTLKLTGFGTPLQP